ncbi:hypothetical protein JOQ06_024051, partial [Pogonophryne albipinna]
GSVLTYFRLSLRRGRSRDEELLGSQFSPASGFPKAFSKDPRSSKPCQASSSQRREGDRVKNDIRISAIHHSEGSFPMERERDGKAEMGIRLLCILHMLDDSGPVRQKLSSSEVPLRAREKEMH